MQKKEEDVRLACISNDWVNIYEDLALVYGVYNNGVWLIDFGTMFIPQ